MVGGVMRTRLHGCRMVRDGEKQGRGPRDLPESLGAPGKVIPTSPIFLPSLVDLSDALPPPMEKRFDIESDIRQASTVPAWFYRDEAMFERTKETIFAHSWQLVGDTDSLKAPGQIVPVTLLEGFLDEPLILTRDQADQVHCLSNVCTHRGTILVEGCTNERAIQCRYHGRRFALDGKFLSMPEFDQAE